MASKKLKRLVLSPEEKAYVAATAYGETGHLPEAQRRFAVSDKDAHGRMQITKGAFKDIMGSLKGWGNPDKMEDAGIRYAVQQFRDFKGDPARAAGAYVRGPTAERQNRPYPGPRTKSYIPKVVAEYNRLLSKMREKQMANTSGFLKMNPKERRIRVRRANRAIQTAKSVGMEPKASDLNILKMASKADKGPITKKEMRSDRRTLGDAALTASLVVPGALAVRGGVAAAKGIGKLAASRTASAAAKKVAAQKAKKAAAAKAKREAAKKAKQAQEKANAARKAREAQGRSSAGGAADDAVAQGVSAAAKKAARKKVTDAAKKKAAQQKKLAAQRKASANRNKVNRPPVANKKYQTNADGSLKLRNGKPILKKPTTAAKPKTPAKPKTDSKMVPTKPGRPNITKKAALTTAAIAGGAGLLSLLPSGKKETSKRDVNKVSAVRRPSSSTAKKSKTSKRIIDEDYAGRRPSSPTANRKSTAKQTSNRVNDAQTSNSMNDADAMDSGIGRGSSSKRTAAQTSNRVNDANARDSGAGGKNAEKKGFNFADIFDSSKYKKTSGPDDSSPAKRTYDTPFGSIDIDSSKEGMAFEEFDQKYGGKVMTRKKGRKAKPRRRAALRGHRAEQRGG